MNRELIVSTLFQYLTAPPMVFAFTADTTTGSADLTAVSDIAGLMVGMPVAGDGVPLGATVAAISPTVTLSLPAYADRSASPLLQGFQTTSRRGRDPSAEQDMPALYMVELNELHGYREATRGGYLAELNVDVHLYTAAGAEEAAVPASALNYMIDALERALNPPANHPGGLRQNLGLKGVHYCRIEGELVKFPGDNAQLGSAVVPIKIGVAPHVDTVAYP